MSSFVAIVLAAGQGKRMKSRVTKVLHKIAGRPLIHYPVQAARDAGASKVVVVVSPDNRERVDAYFAAEIGSDVGTAVQPSPRGTGDAARIGLEALDPGVEEVLVLCGDTPLLRSDDVAPLIVALRSHTPRSLVVLSCKLETPTGYGRIIRDDNGQFTAIREERDLANERERAIDEINAGVYVARRAVLENALSKITPNNAQGEYYLTDVVPHVRAGEAVAVPGSKDALVGVNDRQQLVDAEAVLLRRIRDGHAKNGVTIRGDAQLDASVEVGTDVEIEAGVRIRGKTRIGEGTYIDVGSVITDCTIGRNVVIKPYSVLTSSTVDDGAQIGPFSHLRPGSDIGKNAHIGNFVEVKQTRVGEGAKANHLAYLGDGDVGAGSNIGAGTIFCNYDGFAKNRTIIGEGVFIGSDSQLVAPVTIGKGAYVATGTTVTKDVPDEALAIGRAKQQNKEGYGPRLKARLKSRSKPRNAG